MTKLDLQRYTGIMQISPIAFQSQFVSFESYFIRKRHAGSSGNYRRISQRVSVS